MRGTQSAKIPNIEGSFNMEEAKKGFGSPVPKKEKIDSRARVSDTYLKRPTAFWKLTPFTGTTVACVLG